MTYKNLTKEEMKTVFNKMTGYGLDLLGDVIEAWQFNHEEDGTLLKKVYDDVRESKKQQEFEENTTAYSQIIGLKNSLKNMDGRQLTFIEDILELDPYDVFGNNPYLVDEDEDYQKENIGVNPYREICEYVNRERERRLSYFVNTADLFDQRFKKSMAEKNDLINNDQKGLYSKRFNRSVDGKSTYESGNFSSYSNYDTNELITRRFNRSIDKKLTYKPGSLSPYSK